MDDEELPIKQTKDHVLGGDLSGLSVDELVDLTDRLQGEQVRVELEIQKKRTQSELAENLFKS